MSDSNELGCQGRGLNPDHTGSPRVLVRHSCQSSAEITANDRAESDGKSREVPRLSPIVLPVGRRTFGAIAELSGAQVASVQARIRRLSTVDPETGCWNWNGTRCSSGYGRMKVPGRSHVPFKAHRVAYEVFVAPITDEALVCCHTCDNRRCVNPEHLWLGTANDNWRDAIVKGRWNINNNRQNRTTDDDVREIRRRVAAGESRNAVAASMGLSMRCVSEIVSGRSRSRVA
jgi:hypothetical protein